MEKPRWSIKRPNYRELADLMVTKYCKVWKQTKEMELPSEPPVPKLTDCIIKLISLIY